MFSGFLRPTGTSVGWGVSLARCSLIRIRTPVNPIRRNAGKTIQMFGNTRNRHDKPSPEERRRARDEAFRKRCQEALYKPRMWL